MNRAERRALEARRRLAARRGDASTFARLSALLEAVGAGVADELARGVEIAARFEIAGISLIAEVGPESKT